MFQDGHLAELLGVATPGPIVSFLPVLLIGILFGLAMDYEVFLVSRMREAYVRSGKPRESIVTGYGQSGRVVTAAAVIMTGVFAAFLLDPDPVVKSIGLSLAIGVLADAFVVRMTLVPAVMALLGHSAWKLPRRLERIVPSVDIEGERLAHSLEPSPRTRNPVPQRNPTKGVKMSTSTYAAAAPASTSRRMSLLGRTLGGMLAVAALVAAAVLLWPPSEADKARDDGEQMGQAVSQLYSANSASEVDAALAEVHTAAVDARDHAGDAVSTQVADQEDALNRAVDGFVGANTTDDAFEAELYEAELDTAVTDLTAQASDFRAEGPDVQQAYWEGFEDGLAGN